MVDRGARRAGVRRTLCLRAIARIDVNVFDGKVASPHACRSLARTQIDADRHILSEHLLVGNTFIEGMLAAAAADGYAGDPDVGAGRVEFDARTARRSQNAPPIRVGARESRLYQGRIRDRAGDLAC